MSERPDIVMPAWSRHAGQTAEDNGRYTFAIDGGPEALANGAAEAIVDHFRHEGRFWRAAVPLDGVRQVRGQAYNFSPPKTRQGENGPETRYHKDGLPKRKLPILNHIQSRFTFYEQRPVRLYPPGADPAGEPDHVTHDIVYSVEALGPPGITFNFRDAAFGNLLCTHRLLSLREMVFERVAVEGQYLLESPPLCLDDEAMRRLLVGSLQRGNAAGMDEPYYLFRLCGTNNCTSNTFQILDEVMRYTWPQWIGAMLYRLPLKPRWYLRVRGLDTAPGERRFVREEFIDYLNDPETRKRRREHVRKAIAGRRAGRAKRKPSE